MNKQDEMQELFDGVQPVNKDGVNHPAHYNRGNIEVIDFIDDQELNFDLGNAVKYICRAGFKESSTVVEDLKKAIWYLQHEIKKVISSEIGGKP